jgi:hypothetical protein
VGLYDCVDLKHDADGLTQADHDAAVEIQDLRFPPSNRLEALKGNRKGYWCIRHARQLRRERKATNNRRACAAFGSVFWAESTLLAEPSKSL